MSVHDQLFNSTVLAYKLKLSHLQHVIEKARENWEAQKAEDQEITRHAAKLRRRQKAAEALNYVSSTVTIAAAFLTANPLLGIAGAIALASNITASCGHESKAVTRIATITGFIALCASGAALKKIPDLLTKVDVSSLVGRVVVSIKGVNLIAQGVNQASVVRVQANMQNGQFKSEELSRHLNHLLKDASHFETSFSVEKTLLRTSRRHQHISELMNHAV